MGRGTTWGQGRQCPTFPETGGQDSLSGELTFLLVWSPQPPLWWCTANRACSLDSASSGVTGGTNLLGPKGHELQRGQKKWCPFCFLCFMPVQAPQDI